MIISVPSLFIDGAFTGSGGVAVENGLIIKVFEQKPLFADVVLQHGCLTPGLIDIHNNGAFGVDFATAGLAEWQAALDGLAKCGVTSVLPTVITAPLDDLRAAAARVLAAMAVHGGVLGLHLEGPFLSPAKRGAHRADWLQLPSQVILDELLDDAAIAACLRVMTLAPELPGAMHAIIRLAAAGIVVSLGHSAADAAQMRDAANAGARLVTHVFNAQSSLMARAPGVPGIALTDASLHPCLIADGLHVAPEILQLAFAACSRAIAVSDSIFLAGLAVGDHGEFGGSLARLAEDGLARREDGTICGAAITLDVGIRRLIEAGIAPEIALAAATSRPAEALGLQDRGRIVPGLRADLVWWDEGFNALRTWEAGQMTASVLAPIRRSTEAARLELMDLETRPALAIVKLLLAQERQAQIALAAVAPGLAALAEAIAGKLAKGGRLFYAGAGTSGRLAVLDAVECGPTFGIAPGLIVPLLAGGDGAMMNAVEGAEDDAAAAGIMLTAAGFSVSDALVGIAASGATPFTLGALQAARDAGGLTGAIVNNTATPMQHLAEYAVVIDSGAEVIAGSTRLAAGTTQKIALNILSTLVMIRLGKTRGPYMVNLRVTNEKLRRRAVGILMALSGLDTTRAKILLATHNDNLIAALAAAHEGVG